MKKKELNNLRNKTIIEINKEINDRRERLLNLGMDLSLGKVKNISEINELKKSVAQLLTIKKIKEKEQKST